MRSRVPHPAVPDGDPKIVSLESAVEDLGLSVRTRNALRAIGCDTVENVLALDLGSSVRGLGRKTKEELLVALELKGFRHPALEQQPASEIQVLERSLDKMQTRVDAALVSISKEIRLLKQRLRKTRPGVS
uniref:RNA polymerase, alpha subunit domain protein n=1 Tax=Solibacter usitatus (strain Ellin6076) TaxID=234267 RepID=Q01V32_SOLUE